MKPKYLLETLKQFAINKGGELLSTVYISIHDHMTWKCALGHIWNAKWANILNGTWCPFCAKTRHYELSELQEYAKSREGTLISEKYENCKSKLIWKCAFGHVWSAHWDSMKIRNRWCPTCAGQTKPTLEHIRAFAETRKGKLLSTEYKNNHTKLKWQCEYGHVWENNWDHVHTRNQWCPFCSTLKSEKQCIEAATEVFGLPFRKTRIYKDKLLFLEFDGFNEDRKIAIEYNGVQHYKYNEFLHKGDKNLFKIQQGRDIRKRNYCKENLITLIEIPYTCKDFKALLTTHLNNLS